MLVAPAQVFGVLSHELRSPIGVLQGYVRLLQRMPDTSVVDPAIFEGMRGAASTLETLGRDAALLARWLDGRAAPTALVPLATLYRLLAAAVPGDHRLAPLSGDLTSVRIATPDAGQLAEAIGTVCRAASRERDGSGTEVTVGADGPTEVVVTVVPDRPPPATATATKPFSFESSGLGLGLVLAGAVLDGHGATVTDRRAGSLAITLPGEQEAA